MKPTRVHKVSRLALLCALPAGYGCSTGESESGLADTNTNWVVPCEEDRECESRQCVGGLCAPPPGPSEESSSGRAPASTVAEPSEPSPMNGMPTPPASTPNDPGVPDWDVSVSAPDVYGNIPSIRWVQDRFVVAWNRDGQLNRVEVSPQGDVFRAQTAFENRAFLEPKINDVGDVMVVASSSFNQECAVAVFDPDLAWVNGSELPCGPDVVAAPVGENQWLIARGANEAPWTITVQQYDPRAEEPLSEAVPVGVGRGSQGVSAFATSDTAFVAWQELDGASTVRRVRGLLSPDVAAVEVLTVARPVPTYDSDYSFAQIAGKTWIFGTDTAELWAAELTANGALPPQTISATGVADVPIGIAVAEELGVIGLCYTTGPGPYTGATHGLDGAAFVAIDDSGVVVSGPTQIVDGTDMVERCDVAWSGQAFALAYWAPDVEGPSEVRVRRLTLEL